MSPVGPLPCIVCPLLVFGAAPCAPAALRRSPPALARCARLHCRPRRPACRAPWTAWTHPTRCGCTRRPTGRACWSRPTRWVGGMRACPPAHPRLPSPSHACRGARPALRQPAGNRWLCCRCPPRLLQQLAARLFEERPESLGVNAAVCLTFQRVHWKGGGSAGGIVEYMSEARAAQVVLFTALAGEGQEFLLALPRGTLRGSCAGCVQRCCNSACPARCACALPECRSIAGGTTPTWARSPSCPRSRACHCRWAPGPARAAACPPCSAQHVPTAAWLAAVARQRSGASPFYAHPCPVINGSICWTAGASQKST